MRGVFVKLEGLLTGFVEGVVHWGCWRVYCQDMFKCDEDCAELVSWERMYRKECFTSALPRFGDTSSSPDLRYEPCVDDGENYHHSSRKNY